MIKKGFTLAEALISLAIIGIIAMLLIPRTFKNIEAQKTGPMLGKVVSDIEHGCQMILQSEFSANNETPAIIELLDIAQTDADTFVTDLASKIGAEVNGANYSFTRYKAGYSIAIVEDKWGEHVKNDVVANITIDTDNFGSGDDTLGHDQFQFQLRNNGKMIPVGIGNESTCPATPANCAARVVMDGYKVKYDF